MCNACGFQCCAWDGFSNCGCDDCENPECWTLCEFCGQYAEECNCGDDYEERGNNEQ